MAVELATAYVSLTASAKGIAKSIQGELGDPLAKAGDDAGSESSKRFGTSFATGLKSVAKIGAVAFGAAFVGAVAFGKQAIGVASDVEESMSKVNTVFGDQSATITDWASGAATSIGLAKGAALDAAGGFGNMFTQLGIGNTAAADMSIGVSNLAADFASFHNADITEVLDAQSAAFRGEYDSLQRFLPLINAAAVEQKAMAMTGKDNAKELTAQEKALATYELMLEGAGAAQGDFARTSDGVANQQRILSAQWKNMQATIGKALLPVMASVVSFISSKLLPALPKIGKAFSLLLGDDGAYGFAEVMDNVFGNTGKLIPVFEKLGVGLRGVFFGLKTAGEAVVGFFVDNWGTIQAILAGIAAAVQTAFQGIITSVSWVIDHKPILIGVLTAIGVGVVTLFAAWALGAASAAAATLAAIAPFIAIGAAIAAVVAGVIYAYQNWEWFRTAVDAVRAWMVDTLWPAIQAVFGWLRDNVPPILQAIASFFTDKVLPAIQAVWQFISEKLWPIFQTFGEFLLNAYVAYVQAVIDIITTLWGWLQTLWDRSEGLRGFLAGAFAAGLSVAKDAFVTIKDAVVGVYDWLKTMWDRSEGLRAFLADAFSAGVDVAEKAIIGVKNALLGVWEWLKTVWDRAIVVGAFLGGAFKLAVDAVKLAFDFAKGAVEGVSDAIQWVIDKAVAAIGPIRTLIDWINKIPDGIPGVGGLGVGGSGEAFGPQPRANGGPVTAGNRYIVGERGWEIFTPRTSGYITPHDESVDMLSGARGASTAVTINHYGQTVTPATISAGLAMARMQR